MNKPASCRAALEAALPYLVTEPDRLVMFIDDGHIGAGYSGPSFEYQYTLTIGLLDFNQHPDTVMVPLLHWLRENEPGLLQNQDRRSEAIRFAGEIRNHDCYDLRLQLQLTERVKVTSDSSGSIATHLPEPDLAAPWPVNQRLRIFVKDELVYDSQPR